MQQQVVMRSVKSQVLKMGAVQIYVRGFMFSGWLWTETCVFQQKKHFLNQGFVINGRDKLCTLGSVFNEVIRLFPSELHSPKLNTLATSLGQAVSSGL